jgi:hypothetical protein
MDFLLFVVSSLSDLSHLFYLPRRCLRPSDGVLDGLQAEPEAPLPLRRAREGTVVLLLLSFSSSSSSSSSSSTSFLLLLLLFHLCCCYYFPFSIVGHGHLPHSADQARPAAQRRGRHWTRAQRQDEEWATGLSQRQRAQGGTRTCP